MRFVLLRPALKRPLIRILSITPGVLLAIKRFGVRAGLAQSMGHGHTAINGRPKVLVQELGLSARGAQILDELRNAMAVKDD
ncbi:hypothetical protein [Pseudoxanthomonas sp. JBR18]|uniref:hypothetical protein n=1 Tax=Pseudoxanthomonas sp. JBR18 TaxID=2969308 RepID=UPI002305AD39|nr:hypothetical protein [Pseudoxanthomonas sp. JBR18]WCE05198.1 hypothetical protein PJ250_04245 [Pseudoxanthomonas sp. JBR18]